MKKTHWNAKKTGFAAVTIMLAVFLILLGPMELFTHSAVASIEFPEMESIPPEQFGEDILLAEGESFEF